MSHGDPTGVNGNACVESDNEVEASGQQRVTGDLLVNGYCSSVKYDEDAIEGPNKCTMDSTLEDVFDDVRNLSSKYKNKCGGFRRESLKIDKVTSTNFCTDTSFSPYVNADVAGNTAYVCLDKLEIKEKWTLKGDCDVVFNIFEQLKVNEGENISENNQSVVFNVLGTKDVAFSGGGGGLDCCKAVTNGSIVAPNAEVKLSPGRVNGIVASGENIVLSGGSFIDCPPPTPISDEPVIHLQSERNE